MAKLRGAKKAAFLRRMARGRARASGGRVRTRRTRRRRLRNGLTSINPRRARKVRRLRFRNPLAVLANPGFSLFGAGKPRRKRRKKAMAKRRRRKARRTGRRVRARRASPRRRRRVHRRRPAVRRRRSPRRRMRARRLQRGVVYINPRRRRHRRSRHRRNPGFGGTLKRAFVPYATGFVVSAATAVLDTGLANYPVVKQIVKVVGALSIAAFAGRRYPMASTAAIAALGATGGYAFGTKLAGGMLAQSPAQAVKGLGNMAAVYPEMGALLNGGMGALLNGPDNLDQTVIDYQQAVANMADDD